MLGNCPFLWSTKRKWHQYLVVYLNYRGGAFNSVASFAGLKSTRKTAGLFKAQCTDEKKLSKN